MMFNATFNNISVISWRKLEYPEKTTDLLQDFSTNKTDRHDILKYIVLLKVTLNSKTLTNNLDQARVKLTQTRVRIGTDNKGR